MTCRGSWFQATLDRPSIRGVAISGKISSTKFRSPDNMILSPKSGLTYRARHSQPKRLLQSSPDEPESSAIKSFRHVKPATPGAAPLPHSLLLPPPGEFCWWSIRLLDETAERNRPPPVTLIPPETGEQRDPETGLEHGIAGWPLCWWLLCNLSPGTTDSIFKHQKQN